MPLRRTEAPSDAPPSDPRSHARSRRTGRAARARSLGTIASGLVAVALLAACASPPPAPCPDVRILSGTESANFAADGRVTDDPGAVVHRGAVLGFRGGCDYRSSGLLMRIFVTLTAVPGPAYAGGPMPVRYFLAVQNPSGEIIDKAIFEAALPPSANGRAAVSLEETIEQTITTATEADGSAWRILIGLDLTSEEATRRRRDTR